MILFLTVYSAALIGCFVLCAVLGSPWWMLLIIPVVLLAIKFVIGGKHRE